MTRPFQVLPAIDLRAGRCVRLFQGDYGRETVFGDDPVAMARRWEALGAQRLHVVDLDGARDGRPVQIELVGRIARSVQVPIEVGGGLRSEEHVQQALDQGAERVVLGSAAIGGSQHPEARAFRLACLERFGARVVLGLDARDGKLAVHGWTETTTLDVFTVAGELRDEGFGRIVFTDIARDGALSGPNVGHLRRLATIAGLAVIASGGISSIDDLVRAAEAGAEGAIIGQALYTGALTLPAALERLGGPDGA